MTENEFIWQCPNCKQALNFKTNQWRCENNHCFDLAKEGYVNLLLANKKNSKDPGDNKEMIASRRRFLSQGYYSKLAQVLRSKIDNLAVNKPLVRVLDVGCGEGYYLHQTCSTTNNNESQIIATGIDISKYGVAKAAKLCKKTKSSDYHFSVASAYDLPLPSNSQDIVLTVFAPSCVDEVHRVLNEQGVWVQVKPASEHLYELKTFVYENAEQHAHELKQEAGFSIQHSELLHFEIPLDDEASRLDLLAMTPFFWFFF